MFQDCKKLSQVSLPDGLSVIGNQAFYGCNSLEYIAIPSDVKGIGYKAFCNCNLKSIVIPAQVDFIDDYAFADCYNLNSVTSLIQEPFVISDNTFFLFDENTEDEYFTHATLYVPKGTKVKYEATDGWKLFNPIVETDNEQNVIDAVTNDCSVEKFSFLLGGQRIVNHRKGLNIIRHSNGTIKKVIVR